ncbi:hypothetical protein E3N88_34333 [Mikania micrantha]|uniref:Kinesin motor domain-containing protein n=1 Tax=Mikania micrantha TaxID=192012 RepID=A0A5N6M0H3_9ASTR|nr:hypothetical protein E3N88_34333 [Mikania micrantha]
MLRDFKLSRRNSGKNLKFEEIENVPVNSNLRDPSVGRFSTDSHSRPPLNTIQEPPQNPSKPDYESGLKSSKLFRTPTKPKVRNQESGMQFKTPEKQGVLARNRYGWGQEPCRTLPKGSLGFPESNSTHSTPTKSVGKPANFGLVNGGSSRPPVNGGIRIGNFTALSKGIPVSFNACTTVNTVEVPHFDLRRDPSFWMDHNVQVLIRIRPLNSMEISSHGYNRCLKQENAQSLTWVAQPETRFTFDHVACETIDQETLFRMVGQPMVENCLSGYNSCMFAYGQTGSGKTHTMLGEINDLEIKLSPNRGMTPRIFEFLFARIFAEEESRKDERLKYMCKCSFLEIYNEQITDLLDPSSTNLQLREDVKKGVYVENLTEYEVYSVGDILKLLSQGSANRRVAATNMNRESSRSHSVFTCVIESRWEKDSTSNLRFARLNLVDLAGSERQKTSGAEGERLKEAANINKSLSTLGHVIMVLVDGANARTRHVPYRDSKLTFLLQDSLGGNSKTMIIANVNPSISSAIETLNTLKFAQRAKLIQNNAVINEDASGDVVALQNQIRLLKEELAILKRQNTFASLSFSSKDEDSSNASSYGDDDKVLRVSCKQLKSLESSLNGALRREKSTENCIKQFEAEIKQLNCLVHQREEENRCTKMMLKFREDKIQKMESVFTGLISADSYLIEENNTLTEEIKILHAKVERNPEVTRFAVENIRLLEQLKRFQDFYEEGERETLLAEVTELRDQLALVLDENNHMNLSIEKETAEDKKEIDSLQFELKKTQEELEKCRDNLNSCLEKNTKLCREIYDLNALLEMQKSSLNDQDVGIETMKDSTLEFSSIEDQSSQTVQEKDEIFEKYPVEIVGLQLELEFLKIVLEEERLIHMETKENFSLVTKTYEQSILKEKETQQELTLLRETCEEKDRNFTDLAEEFDLLTNNIEEVLTMGHNALADASNFIEHGKQKPGCENLQIIARKISEKELRIDELNTCLEDAKIRGNEMEMMLRSLRGAILVMSEAHQKDCIKKDDEIEKLLSELNEKNSIIIQMEDQTKLYKAELMDAKINAAQQAMESCCYLDKFVEIQHNIKEADIMINNLVTVNEATKMELNQHNQVNIDKDVKIRCLEAEKIHMTAVLEKCKEEIIFSYVDMQLKDWILLEKDAEVGLLFKEKELYEGELMDAMKNKTQEELQSCCYLDKFDETQQKIKDADFMFNKLVNENEAMKIEVNELKRKEMNFINESEILKDSCSNLEKQLKMDAMGMKRTVQVINEKNEELKSFEEKLVMDLFAKDVELFMMSSKLEQVASENNNLEKDNISMSKVFEKFKEEVTVSYVDLHFKDLNLLEKDTLQNKVEEQEDLKLQQELENKGTELRLHKEENEKLVMIIKNQKDEIEEFDACFESLEYAHQENMIKSLVLEAQLTEKLGDALKAKRLTEEELAETKKAMENMEFKIAFDGNMMESLKGDLENVTCERDNLHVEFLKAKELHELELTDAKTIIAQQAVESCCYLDKFVETQNNIKKADSIINKLLIDLSAKEIELCIMSSKLQEVVLENNDIEKEKISMSEVFEKIKEEMIISHMDLHFKDLILLETDADLRLHKEENETLSVKIIKQKDEIAEIEGVFDTLEYELYENIVKSLVLECWSTEQLTCFHEQYEVELTDTKLKVQEADIMINKLVTENEEMKMEINDQNQIINATETELFIILSRLQELASENNNLEKEKINVFSLFERFKEEIIMSYQACETRKQYDEKKLKLYEKTVDELESTVNLLENQVDLVKGDAECQRLKKEDLEQEVKKILQQNQLLVTENKTFKTENEVHKTKIIELEDEVTKLLGYHQQSILPLAKIKEENNMLKAQNDENSYKLRKAEAIVARVKEEVADLRASNGMHISDTQTTS